MIGDWEDGGRWRLAIASFFDAQVMLRRVGKLADVSPASVVFSLRPSTSPLDLA